MESKGVKSAVKTKVYRVVVTRTSSLGEVIVKYPKTTEVLLDFGLHCVGCGAMHYDTIESGARIHGFNDEEIDELVIRINEVIKFDE